METTVIIAVVCVVLALVIWGLHHFGGVFHELRGPESEEDRHANVLRSGHTGKAVVRTLTDTDEKSGDLSIMLLKLMVRTEHWKPYEVTVRTPVKAADLPKLQPGSELNVKIDHRNADSVALVL